ncbi:MAG: hypothetical protein MUO72_12365 [Bacteroidales bacterium]|nr:hypothetical protein [Bacteroidales bacterium]
MRIGFVRLSILILFIPVIVSCKRNHYKINTSSIHVDIQIKRLEIDLFSMNPDEVIASVPSLKEKYGTFLQLFSLVINTGDTDDPVFGDYLASFCTDKQNNEVYSLTMQLYPEVKSVENELEEAFRHYLWYFPGRKIPAVYTCITGFNNSIITGDSVLAIGLDRYLGTDCEYYPRLEIYKYIAARMNSWNIVPDCIYGWGASEWICDSMDYPAENVMSKIVHEGKLKYFEKCMLPEINDTILFGFTSDQMKFCRNNESQMWLYLLENDLIFSSDQFIIRKLTGEAPFTSYFTSESPGRAAVWLGFRIVESYMMKNPAVKLEEMMNNTDIQALLEQARYNPQ